MVGVVPRRSVSLAESGSSYSAFSSLGEKSSLRYRPIIAGVSLTSRRIIRFAIPPVLVVLSIIGGALFVATGPALQL